MSVTYPAGTRVVYPWGMPDDHTLNYGCGESCHHGTTKSAAPDAAGREVVTVEFDCGALADIPVVLLLSEDDD